MKSRKPELASVVSIQTAAAIDNMADVWAELERLRPTVKAVRPPNSFTVSEFARKRGISIKSAQTALTGMEAAKQAVREKCMVVCSDGILRPTYCYSICKG